MEKDKLIYITDSPAETKKIGELLAKTILENVAEKKALVLSLRGDLGAGKTQFVQGFARGLGIKETVNSPTFVILKKYSLAKGSGYRTFYHIDCYRLGSGRDLEELGVAAILKDGTNIVALEWPGVVAKDLPLGDSIEVEFEVRGPKERRIAFL